MKLIKLLPLMFLAGCIQHNGWFDTNNQDDETQDKLPPIAGLGNGCNTLESEIQYDWYGYLGVAPFIQPIILCADMDLMEDDYVTFTYANLAPIDVYIDYENYTDSEAHLIVREFKMDEVEGMVWGPIIEETLIQDTTHSTQMTIFPLDGYDRLFIAVVPCIVEMNGVPVDSVPYQLTIHTQ